MALIDDFTTPEELAETEKEIIAHRRRIHEHPETAGNEIETGKYVASVLDSLGIEHKKVADTGLVAVIRGGDGPVVGLRADMDALPIEEMTGKPYASKCKGVMHACGHDGHTAILLGAAKILSAHRDRLGGSVKLFFQPAEESFGGAERMIRDGVMEDPHVDFVLGLHVANEFMPGDVGIRYGEFYAASDPFDVVVKGKGAHGAHPELGIDAIVIAAKIIDALQLVVSRVAPPQQALVVTVGKINGGNVRNQISDRVEMKGIIRTLDNDFRVIARDTVRRVITETAAVYGGEAEVTIHSSYPALINDDAVTALVEKSAADVLGAEHIHIEKTAEMGAEDFAYFAMKVPSCFFHLGCRSTEPGVVPQAHNAYFDMDESCLIDGVKVQVNNVLTLMKKYERK
jgi:amidohydrolase